MGALDGKIAIVTGGNRGIGKGIARGLVAAGASVVISARGQAELDQTTAELSEGGVTVVPIPPDVTSESDVERVQHGSDQNVGEPMMSVDELAQTGVWMALLPPHVTMLEATVIPIQQLVVERG